MSRKKIKDEAFLDIHSGTSWTRSVHMLCTYWGFVLMSIHLGFHWNMMMTMAAKPFHRKMPEFTGLSVTFISDLERGKPTAEIEKNNQISQYSGDGSVC